ncbi:MAG: MurR/RpiR family transcriptional regulator, partial [Candidatus Binatia bacterium]
MILLEQISRKIESLSGAHKRLGEYILTDSSALLLSTGRELAQSVGVSESTVVRFAKTLGYEGFPDLKRELQKEIRPRLRAATRMKKTIAGLDKEENILVKLIERDIQLLRETLHAVSLLDFHKAVEVIWRARKVFIIGFSASLALVYFLQFRLARLKKDVRWIFL